MSRRTLVRIAGWFLLLVPLVPVARVFGGGKAGPGSIPQGLVPPTETLLGLFIFGAVALLLGRMVPERAPAATLRWLGSRGGRARLVAVGSFGGLAILLFGAATFAFSRRPLLVDSVIQLFQARIFASGGLTAAAPPDEAFFAVQHMIVDGPRWYSQYPPGHSALLGLGVLVDQAWLVPVLLSLGTAALMFDFTRRAYDLTTARVSLLLLLASPFFWFMGASHMNHVSSLFFVVAFLRFCAMWEESGHRSILFAAGLAIGAVLLIRPLEAIAVGLALAPGVLRRAWRRRAAGSVIAGAAGAMIALGVYLGYNALTTGDAFLPGYVRLWGAEHGLGFHGTPWGDTHTPLAGLANELTDLGLLGSFMFEWPLPALIPAGLLFAAGWGDGTWDRRLLSGFLAIPAAYFFYWHRDAFLGPRYLYAGLAFFTPLTARGLIELFRRTAGRQVWRGSAITRVPIPGAAATLLVLCLLYSSVYAIPRRFGVYRSGLASMKVDLVALAEDGGIREAVVFVPVSWGNRLLARMRALGVPAQTTELAYRTADHCDVEGVVRRAEAEGQSPEAVAAAILALSREGRPVPTDAPLSNGDPTLLLRDGVSPGPDCLAELAHDRLGYGNYAPFLADQDPSLRGPIVVARDLRARNYRLTALYPGRPAYVFRGGRFHRLEGAGD